METVTAQTATERDIDDLIVDPDVNIRAKSPNSKKVTEYAEIADSQERAPIETFIVIDEKGQTLGHYVVNGIHRLAGRKEAGFTTIYCINVGEGSLAQASDVSDLSNIRNGLENTPEQKREIGLRLHARHPEWKQKELAKEMNVAESTVSEWLHGKSRDRLRQAKKSQTPRATGGLLSKNVRDMTRWWKTMTSKTPVEEWTIERLTECKNELSKLEPIEQAIKSALQAKGVGV